MISKSMRSVTGFFAREWSVQLIRQTPCCTLTLKLFCAQATQNQDSLSRRIERLPKGEPVGSAFRSWMRDGFPVHGGDVFHSINRLRKLNKNKRALQVSYICSNSLVLNSECDYLSLSLDFSFLNVVKWKT